MKPFLIRWLITTLAVAVATQLTGMESAGVFPLIGAALLLGIVNAFIRPVLLLLSFPLILVTLGFFILVINALLLWAVGSGMVPGFQVESFWQAFFGAILISIVSWLLSAFFKGSDGRVHVLTHHAQVKGMKQVSGRVVGGDVDS